jgi:hypothetical protein
MVNPVGRTPLHYAYRPDMLPQLQTKPKEWVDLRLNVKDGLDRTPLMHMVVLNNITGIEFLCERGADVRVTDDHGRDVLFYATIFASADVVNRLLNAGLNPFREDKFGMSPYQLATLCSFKTICNAFIESREHSLARERERRSPVPARVNIVQQTLPTNPFFVDNAQKLAMINSMYSAIQRSELPQENEELQFALEAFQLKEGARPKDVSRRKPRRK